MPPYLDLLAFHLSVPMLWAHKAEQTLGRVGNELVALRLMLPLAVVRNCSQVRGVCLC